MFKVRDEFIDENSKLVGPDKLPIELKKKYNEIENIYKTIYRKGIDIDIFYW